MLPRERNFLHQYENKIAELGKINKELEIKIAEQSKIKKTLEIVKGNILIVESWLLDEEKVLSKHKYEKFKRLKKEKDETEECEQEEKKANEFNKLLKEKGINIFNLNFEKVVKLIVENKNLIVKNKALKTL